MSVLLFYLSLFVLGLGAHGLLGAFSLVYLEEDGHDLARWFARLGLVSAYRPILSVNASSELTLKRRAYDEDMDTEKVTYGGGALVSGVTRYLRDPQARLHRFLGVRFGFVDEFTGLVFDPRDADVGARAHEHDEAGSLKFDGEPRNGRIPQYIRGVFGLQEGTRGVDLRTVRHLTGGSAYAQAVDYLIEMYKTSQEPRSRGLSVWKMLAPVAALIAVLFLGAKLGGSGGGGGGGGGATVGVGQWLLLALSSRLPFEKGRQRKLAGVLTIVGLLFTTLLFLVFPAGIAWRALIAFVLGLVVLPFVAFFLGKSLGAIGLALAKLYLIIAFFGFDEPVIHLDDTNEYQIREYSELPDHVNDPEWYRFAKTWLGVTYANSEGVWPGRDSTIPADQLPKYQYDTEVTPGLVASSITSAGHTGLVPKRADTDTVYVQTKNVLSSFRDVGRGGLLQRALKQAKEDHFGGNDLDDNTILYMTAGFAVIGLVVDVVVFF